jgi:hypothetical protein
MNKIIPTLIFLLIMVSSTKKITAQNSKSRDGKTRECPECQKLLIDAMKNGETIFIKLHAAEALILNDYYTGVGSAFKELIKIESNLIFASRVLARVYKYDKTKYDGYINTLLFQLDNADSLRGRLIALESLAKLGFRKRLPAILQHADTGTNGFKPMARWVLANSGKAEDEAGLAQLLKSSDPLEFRGAAYALRFRKKVTPATAKLIAACAKRLKDDDPARPYVLSSLYVHGTTAKAEKEAKEKLLKYLNGAPNERYEVAEAFSMKGSSKDFPILNKLMEDENMDVRVAAAKAMWIIKRK